MAKLMRRVVLAATCGAAAVLLYVGCQAGRSLRAMDAAVSATPATRPIVAAVAPVSPAPATRPTTAPAPFSVPVVELRGSGADLGGAHGQRLGTSVRFLHENYLKKIIPTEIARYLALSAAEGFEAQLLPEHREEVAALAKESGLQPREALLGQCFLDITGMVSCSTITLDAAASPDGVPRFGRNLDFLSLDVADKHSTLFIYHPDGKYAFASVGWPGMIGVLSGMNEHGLTIANMEVTRPPRRAKAMPYMLLYRTVLEQCRTTDEAIALLQRTPRQTSNNLMIMDAAGNRALAEISPESVIVRRGQEGAALISTNHRRNQDGVTPGRCKRYDSLLRASTTDFGKIDPQRLESMLAAASQGKKTLQSMVFEPGSRVIYLSAGANAARGTFHRIELKPYFE